MVTQVIRKQDGVITTGTFCLFGAGKSKSPKCKLWTGDEISDIYNYTYSDRSVYLYYVPNSTSPEDIKKALLQTNSIVFLTIHYETDELINADPTGETSRTIINLIKNLNEETLNQIVSETYVDLYFYATETSENESRINIYIDYSEDFGYIAGFDLYMADFESGYFSIRCVTLNDPNGIVALSENDDFIIGLGNIENSQEVWTKLSLDIQGNTISHLVRHLTE